MAGLLSCSLFAAWVMMMLVSFSPAVDVYKRQDYMYHNLSAVVEHLVGMVIIHHDTMLYNRSSYKK